jgi:predicted permease
MDSKLLSIPEHHFPNSEQKPAIPDPEPTLNPRIRPPSLGKPNAALYTEVRQMHSLTQDIRFSLRKLRKSPGFALTAIITLALGVGANVVVFSVLNALVLRPLNIPQPREVYQVSRPHGGWDTQSYPDYIDFRDKNTTFSGLAAYGFSGGGVTIPASGSQERSVFQSWGYEASGNYFDVLGIQPYLGRFFHGNDEHGPNSAPLVVVSYGFWHNRLNSDPNAVGSVIEINKHPYTIVGVAPDTFHGTELVWWPDFWIPMVNEADIEGSDYLSLRNDHQIYVLGRLKPGVSPKQATDNLDAIALHLAKIHPEDESLDARLVQPGLLGNGFGAPTRAFVSGIMLMGMLVLLAACANLASIFAARAADRSRELAIRLAIGSSRWSMVRQLLTESIIVALIGGAAGTVIASLLLQALSRWHPIVQVPIHVIVAPDPLVYVVALLLSLASGILFGLLPARQIWKIDAAQAMKTGPAAVALFRRLTLRDILLAAQITICTLLVTASLVALRGMMRSLHANFGFSPAGVTLLDTDTGMAGYSDESSLALQKRMIEQASQIPGVQSTAIINDVPLGVDSSDSIVYRFDTTDFRESNSVTDAMRYAVSPGYFQTAQTRLLEGRDFTWHDDNKSPNVAIVNATFARLFFGNKSAIGQHFKRNGNMLYEIVGVVEDGKYFNLAEEQRAAMFNPIAQDTHSNFYLLVRSQALRTQIAPSLQRIIGQVDPSLPYHINSWEQILEFALFPARTATVALGIMGLLAAMLAVTGIFGMASYSVTKRMKELGIRVALGAQPAQLMRAALARPVYLLAGGSIAGLILGILASGVLAHIVYQATPHDPVVLGGVVLTMLLLGLLATFVPARRAQSVDPARLLREE